MLSLHRDSIRQYQCDVNLHLATNPSPHTLLSVFYPHKSRWLLHTNFSLSVGCLNDFLSVSPISFFSSCFITWSICGWFMNLRWISESIYLLRLTHRDMLRPITFLFKPMSFWRTACLLKCLSISSATGTQQRANRKVWLSSVHFFGSNTEVPASTFISTSYLNHLRTSPSSIMNTEECTHVVIHITLRC